MPTPSHSHGAVRWAAAAGAGFAIPAVLLCGLCAKGSCAASAWGTAAKAVVVLALPWLLMVPGLYRKPPWAWGLLVGLGAALSVALLTFALRWTHLRIRLFLARPLPVRGAADASSGGLAGVVAALVVVLAVVFISTVADAGFNFATLRYFAFVSLGVLAVSLVPIYFASWDGKPPTKAEEVLAGLIVLGYRVIASLLALVFAAVAAVLIAAGTLWAGVPLLLCVLWLFWRIWFGGPVSEGHDKARRRYGWD